MKIIFSLLLLFTSLIAFTQSVVDPLHSSPPRAAMVLVKGGDFKMGNPTGKRDAKPVHTVTLKDYYIGKYEVTQQVWRAVMGDDKGSKSDCGECPVYDITWESIQLFITKLNTITKQHYRLPTEAEWEYAAAGGNESKGYKYSGSNNLDSIAWYAPNANQKTHMVGVKYPNELGIYDMSGNVWELCSDWYHAGYYKQAIKVQPNNQKKGMFRVSRGGSWRSEEERCQVHARNRDVHDHHIGNCGFRLVLDVG